MAALIQI